MVQSTIYNNITVKKAKVSSASDSFPGIIGCVVPFFGFFDAFSALVIVLLTG